MINYKKKYIKYKEKYIKLKNMNGGHQQIILYDNNINKIIKDLYIYANYAQFAYIKKEEYNLYIKSLIYNHAITIPGKYYSKSFFLEDNKIKIIKKNPKEIIFGWKLPDEQREHNYKVKYYTQRFYKEWKYEIEINLIEKNKNPNKCLLKHNNNITRIELYNNNILISTYIKNNDIIENKLENNIKTITLNNLHELFLQNNNYDNYNTYINTKIYIENGITNVFTKEDYIDNNGDLEYNYYKKICKLDNFDQIFYNIIYKYIFDNIEEFNLYKKNFIVKNQKNINYIISRNSRNLSIFNFIFYNNFYSITLPYHLQYKNEEEIINYNNKYGNLCFQKVKLKDSDETNEIFIKNLIIFMIIQLILL